MKWQQITGIMACVLLIISSFLHWTWYPDIEKYFTGFFTQDNYYGRPGIFLCFFAILGILFYYINKNWSNRLNLIFSGLALAYGFTSFLRFSSSYDGFIPEKQPGIFVMIIAALVHLVMAMWVNGLREIQLKIEKPTA